MVNVLFILLWCTYYGYAQCEICELLDYKVEGSLGALARSDLGEKDEEELDGNVSDEECSNEGPGYIKDCSPEELCCPSTWIGDGLCDDKNSTYYCDFSCIIEESVDCVPIPPEGSAAMSLRSTAFPRLRFAVFLLYTISIF